MRDVADKLSPADMQPVSFRNGVYNSAESHNFVGCYEFLGVVKGSIQDNSMETLREATDSPHLKNWREDNDT